MKGIVWGFTLFLVAMLFRITAMSARGFERKLRSEGRVLKPELAEKLRKTDKICMICFYGLLALALGTAAAMTAAEMMNK